MAKRKKKDMKLVYLAIGGLIVFAIILLLVYYKSTEMDRSMQTKGYQTEEKSDPFYKMKTTGNTLDEYYSDLDEKINSAYEEYYLQKESYNFFEQKLAFQDGVTSSLNISSDLRNLYTKFNYELSYQNAYIILEGNSETNFECEVIINRNTSKETQQNACDQIHKEIDIFTRRRTEIMADEKVQELLRNAPSIVEVNNMEE